MSDHAFGAPDISFREPPLLPHLAREQLAMLAIETELCPHVVARILAILAARDVVPFTLTLRRTPHCQSIDIEIPALSPGESVVILQNLRRILNIRCARLLAAGERGLISPLRAKL